MIKFKDLWKKASLKSKTLNFRHIEFKQSKTTTNSTSIEKTATRD